MKAMVMITTYNESENISNLISDIMKIGDNISVIVVDDNSPDGTSKIVQAISKNNSRVHLLTRIHEKGRGTAGICGFQYAIAQGVDYIVEMDSDYSHHPKYIPDLLSAMKECDVAIGSRCVKNGREAGRSVARMFITKFANFYIRMIMGIPVKDCTSGYRCFKREVLESIGIDRMVSTGPSIVEEVLYACSKKKYTIKEVPIVFEDRTKGESTKNLGQYMDTAWKILMFRLRH